MNIKLELNGLLINMGKKWDCGPGGCGGRHGQYKACKYWGSVRLSKKTTLRPAGAKRTSAWTFLACNEKKGSPQRWILLPSLI